VSYSRAVASPHQNAVLWSCNPWQMQANRSPGAAGSFCMRESGLHVFGNYRFSFPKTPFYGSLTVMLRSGREKMPCTSFRNRNSTRSQYAPKQIDAQRGALTVASKCWVADRHFETDAILPDNMTLRIATSSPEAESGKCVALENSSIVVRVQLQK
jgi:hypothetical protein